MTKKNIKNMAASVHERLLIQARQDQRPFNELLQYFAMDRFLYRLSKSKYKKKFVLKGAMMLKVWEANRFRTTRDIDMLANNIGNSLVAMTDTVKEVISIKVEPEDGIIFDLDSITAERITEDAEYQGVRIHFQGKLGNAKLKMQVDVGFGDIVYPAPQQAEVSSMLDFPGAKLLCYSRESAIAEKLHAMVQLGDANSRMKDFYDIYALSRQFDFTGKDLAEAIRITFENRATPLPEEVDSFRQVFISAKEIQWKAFHKKLGQDHVPDSFKEIVHGIDRFISPVLKALISGSGMPSNWPAPGDWEK